LLVGSNDTLHSYYVLSVCMLYYSIIDMVASDVINMLRPCDRLFGVQSRPHVHVEQSYLELYNL